MEIREAIRTRRSVRQFTNRPISPGDIERPLDVAVRGRDHRMTQPWHFYVLGPKARRACGEALGARKAKRVDDPRTRVAVGVSELRGCRN